MAMLLMLAVGLPLLATAQPAAAAHTLRDMAACCTRMAHSCPTARTDQQRDCCQQCVSAPQPAALLAAGMPAPALGAGPATVRLTVDVAANLPSSFSATSPPAFPPRSFLRLRI